MLMQTQYVGRNLREAAEELGKAIEAVEMDNEIKFEVWLAFTYRKLNRAWNSRNLTPEQLENRTHEVSELRCRFPMELADDIAG